mmetsp:Transcript_69935/g.166976  ORF Transcript_69935/g.166976 Transcript_69935/m.166976 type:complete len:239 (-) Transcript_69935:3-719(-)
MEEGLGKLHEVLATIENKFSDLGVRVRPQCAVRSDWKQCGEAGLDYSTCNWGSHLDTRQLVYCLASFSGMLTTVQVEAMSIGACAFGILQVPFHGIFASLLCTRCHLQHVCLVRGEGDGGSPGSLGCLEPVVIWPGGSDSFTVPQTQCFETRLGRQLVHLKLLGLFEAARPDPARIICRSAHDFQDQLLRVSVSDAGKECSYSCGVLDANTTCCQCCTHRAAVLSETTGCTLRAHVGF